MQSKRRAKYALTKIHRNYTVEEAARLLDVHKNTVREWIKAGLPVTDSKRPILILGSDLKDFLQVRRAKNKRPCKAGQLYCVRCRDAKYPAGDMAEYHPSTTLVGLLKALCPDCLCVMNLCVSAARLAQMQGKLSIPVMKVRERISNSNQPAVDSDFR
jgi:excisionase family DNA binding protein